MPREASSKTTVIEALGADETRDLTRCEKIIERGIKTFVAVGNALLEIRDRQLYRAEYSTFEDYCRERWNMSRVHAKRLVNSAAVVENLKTEPMGSVPTNERQARPLARLKPSQQRDAWKLAVESTPGGTPTTKQITAAVEQVAKKTSSDQQMPLFDGGQDSQVALRDSEAHEQFGSSVALAFKKVEAVMLREIQALPDYSARWLVALNLQSLAGELRQCSREKRDWIENP